MFPGPLDLPSKAPAHPKLERWSIPVDGGEVEAFFFPAVGAGAKGPAVIFAHGNGEAIDHWVSELDFYLERGVSLLLVEYRGYGRSSGTPSAGAIVDDTELFLGMLERRPEVDPARVIFHGRS